MPITLNDLKLYFYLNKRNSFKKLTTNVKFLRLSFNKNKWTNWLPRMNEWKLSFIVKRKLTKSEWSECALLNTDFINEWVVAMKIEENIYSWMTPYVPLTCEEVNSIRLLSQFANSRVRLFGELKTCQNRNSEFRILSSLGEEIVSEVLIDFR